MRVLSQDEWITKCPILNEHRLNKDSGPYKEEYPNMLTYLLKVTPAGMAGRKK